MRVRTLAATAGLVALVDAFALVAAVAAAPSAGAEPPTLAGFAVTSTAAPVSITYDSEVSPAPTSPTGELSVPSTSTSLDTGGIGHALASLAWPGPLVGNFGTASQLILPAGPLRDAAKPLDDPVRAEAFSPQGPSDVAGGAGSAGEMAAHADAQRVEASSGGFGLSLPGIVDVGQIVARSTASAAGTSALAEAVATLHDVALGPGGVLRIRTLTSSARVTSDGHRAATEGATVIQGATVLGIPVDLDTNVVGLGGVLAGAARPLLGASGVEIAIVPASRVVDGPKGSMRTSALTVTLRGNLPPIQNVPLNGAQTLRITLGGVAAAAVASPPLDDLLPAPTGPAAADADLAGTAAPGPTATSDVALGAMPAAPPLAPPPRRLMSPAAAIPAPPGTVARSKGVPAGLVVTGLAAALALAAGLARTGGLLADTTASCPDR